MGYQVVVVGGGHAGVEAAWAAANALGIGGDGRATVALVTGDPTKIGVMSCNPAIGGLAKGQLVREIDALGGLMGLATDATGIQFKVLNTSKGPAVHGPRAQCDKHEYAECVQRMIASRREIEVIAGSVEGLVVEDVGGAPVCVGALVQRDGKSFEVRGGAVVLTTGTFMRGLMHTGERKTEGGRFGEHAAVGISGALRGLGFELGRLKTGTPPRIRRGSVDWEGLQPQEGDREPVPFSDMSIAHWGRFPVLEQIACRQTRTTEQAHELIRTNLHRAPMFSGQIEGVGPRYCPSLEDKVVRFAERDSHGVFLEPESLRDDWVYCNGISTSLPADVQDVIVRTMPGCERAEILRYGYAVEYDMVRPHQIEATGETKRVRNLFLAGQINGTSGYEEAAAQGLVAGVNAARRVSGLPEWIVGRDEAYIGVLMDDLVTKTPVEPYRMFTSRAEHRLMLRSDNAAERLTPIAESLGLLSTTDLGRARSRWFAERVKQTAELQSAVERAKVDGVPLERLMRGQVFEIESLREALPEEDQSGKFETGVWRLVHAERRYAAYIERGRLEIKRHAEVEHRRIPDGFPFEELHSMRTEARHALVKFRPRTYGQAGRLEGMTPADLTLLMVMAQKWRGR